MTRDYRMKATFTNLCIFFHKNPTIIPRTTLTKREMASIAIRTAFEVFDCEHSSSELEVELEVELEAELEVDSKTLNNMVKFSRHFTLEDDYRILF